MAGQRRPVATAKPHTPLRPLWLCRACAAPWPCGSARVTLLREYAQDRVALLVYLGGLLHDAADQLHTLNPHGGSAPAQLFDRFVGWALIRRTVDGSTPHPAPGAPEGRPTPDASCSAA
ncbi:hypothetical protein [Micromonospora sp. DT229]|uniref:hypothetical protein n=1 Tax=Micromonospora sp. DT229 TaxID=3393430 RepID=UPI003CF77687